MDFQESMKQGTDKSMKQLLSESIQQSRSPYTGELVN